MKRKITEFNIVLILIFTGLFLIGKQVTATEYYTVSLDSVNFNDTVIYCSGSGPIEVISPTGSTNVVWLINDYQDTIVAQNLIVPDGYNGDISCQYPESSTGALNFSIYPFLIDAGEDLTGTCGNSMQLNVITNSKSSDIVTFHWSSEQDISDSTIRTPYVTPSSDAKYYITVTTLSGCQATDSINILLSPVNAQDICTVGVNDSNMNMIIWEKPDINNIDSVFIYKETFVTDQYKKIGAVSFKNGNSFVDTLSNPTIQSNKYKISQKDICGLETDMSASHKTMHLSINQGQNSIWNLIWEPYEGFPVTTYYIYRGTSKTNLELIGTSPAGNTQFSDITAPEGYVYYQIEIVSPNQCSDLKSSSNSVSRSNIVSFETTGNINQIEKEFQVCKIYPNPGEDEITIMTNDYRSAYLKIINSNGSVVMNAMLSSSETKLDISNIKSGIYFIQIITTKNIVTNILVKK